MSLALPRSTTAGFSLIELLVVLAILGMLAGVVGPRVMQFLSGAKTKTAKLQIEDFSTALDLFHLEVGRYPTSSEGLNALITRPAGASNWNGPYLKKQQVLKDPWGNEYRYQQPGQEGRAFDISSLGSDNSQGGEGEAQDVVSWE